MEKIELKINETENIWDNERNLSMLMDFYELTMSNGYFEHGLKDQIVVFDMFFRKVPDNGGFAIACGLEQLVHYIESLKFNDEDIKFLEDKKIFSKEFLNYLKNFKFSCDVFAVPEGTVVFPNEPLVTVKGPVIEAQLLETMLLITINHQSLIATKTSRIIRAANGRSVMEFGSRRAQGYDGAIYGARASYIAGAIGTACTIVDEKMNIPSFGTMAHSWVQLFKDEYTAFKKYAEIYPDNCVLLVDTYNVLKSGIPNAIKIAKEILEPQGKRLKGIRIDSGDLTYLSVKTRKMLDEAGLKDCSIVVSNSIDEYIINDLIAEGAQIDSFGIGERLITSKSEPVFGGVYKLVAVEEDGVLNPRIKISENVEKITNPHFKNICRIYDKKAHKALADVLTVYDEEIDTDKPYTLFDPVYTWKKKTIENFEVRKIQKQIYNKGKLIYNLPDIKEIKANCEKELESLWNEIKRFENPQTYYVDLSKKLWTIKNDLLEKYKNED